MIDIDPRLLRPTGLNNQFDMPNGDFVDYIRQTQAMLLQARIDITANQQAIIDANSPFDWTPPATSTHPGKRGILLIHGLYDSPFSLMDLGRHLLAQGFKVRSVLLPGHGTVPGDLLTMQRSEWLKTVHYAVTSLQKEAEQVYIAGFSLGGLLAVHHAITHGGITGLILLAPALKLQHQRLARLLYWCSQATHSFKWYRRNVQKSYTRYESFNFNAAYQSCILAQETCALLNKQSLPIPLFIGLSATDETVIASGVIDIFQSLTNPHSRMLLYTPQPSQHADQRIISRSSYYPEQRILDFSHIGLSISPDNDYCGANGIYQDFAHYHYKVPATKTIYRGSISKENLMAHVMQRLTYNPDFEQMMQDIDQFLLST